MHAFGQLDSFARRQPILNVTDQWHSIDLPDELFGYTNSSLSDIRIYGLTSTHDTIEVPYLLHVTAPMEDYKKIGFNLLNTTKGDDGFYFTFEIPTEEKINEIYLDFGNKEYDWRIELSASHDRKKWFTVVDDYRIVSINNENTDFRFGRLLFPESDFRFYRLRIPSVEKPQLIESSVLNRKKSDGLFRSHEVKKFDITQDKKTNNTIIDIELKMPLSVCVIKPDVSDTIDYYRRVTVRYLTDSISTEQGWKYNYTTLTNAIINSKNENEISFSSVVASRFQVIIHNDDNRPLSFRNVETRGYVHRLIARFAGPAEYYLAYGRSAAEKPVYDLSYFRDKVPDSLKKLTLGEVIETPLTRTDLEPLFGNKIWLWVVMSVIILILGWFTLRMMRVNN